MKWWTQVNVNNLRTLLSLGINNLIECLIQKSGEFVGENLLKLNIYFGTKMVKTVREIKTYESVRYYLPDMTTGLSIEDAQKKLLRIITFCFVQ